MEMSLWRLWWMFCWRGWNIGIPLEVSLLFFQHHRPPVIGIINHLQALVGVMVNDDFRRGVIVVGSSTAMAWN